MTLACKICGSTKDHPTYRPREMRLGLREEFEYFQCLDCECLQIVAFPRDMSKYYPSDYYSYASVGHAAEIGRFSMYLRALRLRHRMKNPTLIGSALTSLFGEPNAFPGPFGRLSIDPEARILDYGCGAGDLLCRLAATGYANLTGADPFLPAPVRYPNGVTILKTDSAGIEGAFDFIMMNHSFEHLPNPREVLQNLKERLAPGGSMLIRIPIVSSYAWEHYRENWVQLDAPRHFFLHSLKSIHLLADEAGMQATSVRYDSTALQFWGSEQYLRDIPLEDSNSFGRNPAGSIFSKAEIEAFQLRSEQLNDTQQGDQIALSLRRHSLAA